MDATCPFVSKIHKLVYDASRDGHNIVIVGDEDHPEVMGIKGWCEGAAAVVDSAQKTMALSGDGFFIVCQTTIKKEMLDNVIDTLDRMGKTYTVGNTICSANCRKTGKL